MRHKGSKGKKYVPGKKDIPGKTRGNLEQRIYSFFYYAAEAAALTAVVVTAFYMPQVIFQVQDSILCGDTTLEQRESMDVEALSTAYEQSLGMRMQKYAEGLAENDSFYLTSQNLVPNEELTDYLYSGDALYHQVIDNMIHNFLIPGEIWEDVYYVTEWKQYVIYSDNYAKGVNYILWYIEMEEPGGSVMKVLADAEDHTLYAIKTENNAISSGLGNGMYEYLWDEMKESNNCIEMWGYFSWYYKAISEQELEAYSFWAEKMGWEDVDIDVLMREFYDTGASAEINIEEMMEEIERKVLYHLEGEETLVYTIPFDEDTLDVVLEVQKPEGAGAFAASHFNKYTIVFYPSVTVGVRQIYEMIPEFA